MIYNEDIKESGKMSVHEQVKILCVKMGISVSELARKSGTSQQAFNQKLLRGTHTPADLKKIAESIGCRYESAFLLPNGDRIVD